MTNQNITTLKELRKQLGTIDLSQVRFGVTPYNSRNRYYFDLDEPLKPRRTDGETYFPAFNTDIDGCNPSIDIGCIYRSRRYGSDYQFVGGRIEKQGRGGNRYTEHFLFSDTTIKLRGGGGKDKDEIVRVQFANDNLYLENWLRNQLDPSITEKQFKVCITTTRLERDYEYVEVAAATEEDALQMLRDKDPLLDMTDSRDPYSGMKTSECLTRRYPDRWDLPDPKPVPQSYEEWVSLHKESKQILPREPETVYEEWISSL